MRCQTLAVAILCALAGPAFAQKEYGFDNRKSSGQPYLSPDETVKRMTVAPEFEVKLFAGEPDCVNPIAFTIDEKGRVWVVECFEYPSRTPKGKAPRDRIVILEDTDGDGKCDKRTVFSEGKDFPVPEERRQQGLGAFDLASGIEVGNGGVFVGAPPYLWFIENNGDKPGRFETLLKGFGSQDTHETLNTFQWGPDGWLYGLHGVFTHSKVAPAQLDGPETRMNAAVWRYHPITRKFEVFAEGTSNPWGMDWRNTDGQFILACCVIPHLYHIVPGGIYKRQAGTSFNPYAYGQINEICDHTFHKESGWAHAGLISLDAPHMPEKYRDSVIFGSIHGCSIKQNVLKPNGSTYTASRGDDFLVSGDKNFRPINMKWGPNGDIYLIDWHDQNPCHQAKAEDWDYERGRVYRIQLKGTQPKKAEDLGKKTHHELAALQSSPDPYTARTAHRLGTERRDYRIASIDAVTPSITDKLLKEAQLIRSAVDRGIVRDNVTQLLEAYQANRLFDSPHVRRELASAAVRLADKRDVRPLLHALMQRKEDANDPVIPFLTWLAYEKVLASGGRKAPDGQTDQGADAPRSPVAGELAWLGAQAPENPLVRDQIVPRAMRRLVATGKPEDLALCLKFVADVPDTATRRQALGGLAVALKGRSATPPAEWQRVRAALANVNDPGIRDAVNRIAVSFHDPEAIKRALAALTEAGRPTEARIEAVRELAELRPDEASPLLRELIAQRDAPDSLRVEAVRALAGFDRKDTPAALLANWPTYPEPIRAEVVNLLAGRKDWAKALLTAMRQGQVDRSAVSDNVIVRIEAFEDSALNDLIAKAWGRSRPTPKELTDLIDKARESLAAAPASFTRGKAVFESQCAKCHKFDGRGNEVGPPLDGAGRDIEYILANVIDPNRVIGAPYFQRIVRTEDGRVEQGLLAEEDEHSITLKVENGVLKRFEKKDLDGPVQVVERSMMPEGLTAAMTEQDFRDLVRYAMAHPFVTEVVVNGQPVSVGVPGRIPLPQTGEVTVEAEFTSNGPLKTQVLVGAPGTFAVTLDGQPVGIGQATEKHVAPDQFAFPVELSAGPHKLKLTVTGSGGDRAAYLRLLDPDRKLSYPEAGK